MFQYFYTQFVRSTCVLCDNPARVAMDLCSACHLNLPTNLHCCIVCALPLPPSATQGSDLRCGNCIDGTGPVSESVIPYLYRPPADFMIRRLKYAEDTKYGRLIGELLYQSVYPRYVTLPDCLIPVPLHRSRHRQRGFNQAQVIARHLSARLLIPLDESAVTRTVASDQQAALGARDRERNMRQAFAVTSAVKGKSIAIVDDVYTTGATCTALARSLRASGARRIDVWAFARTP